MPAKCYGSEFSRKRNLLDKQRTGERHRSVDRVDIPQEAFLAVLGVSDDD